MSGPLPSRSALEPQPDVTSDTAKPGSEQRILVVDDDPFQCKLLTLQLEQAGFRVATAQDGLDALEHARTSPPEAIVSDVLMPHLDGFRLSQAIRQYAAGPAQLLPEFFGHAEVLHCTMREDELVEVSASGRGVVPTPAEQIVSLPAGLDGVATQGRREGEGRPA